MKKSKNIFIHFIYLHHFSMIEIPLLYSGVLLEKHKYNLKKHLSLMKNKLMNKIIKLVQSRNRKHFLTNR